MFESKYKKSWSPNSHSADFSGLYIDPFLVSLKCSHKGALLKRPPHCSRAPFSQDQRSQLRQHSCSTDSFLSEAFPKNDFFSSQEWLSKRPNSVNIDRHTKGSVVRLQHKFLWIFQDAVTILSQKLAFLILRMVCSSPRLGKSIQMNLKEVKYTEMTGPQRKCNRPLYCLTESPTPHLFFPILVAPQHPSDLSKLHWNH